MKAVVVGVETLLGQAILRVSPEFSHLQVAGNHVTPAVWRDPSAAGGVLRKERPDIVLIVGGKTAGIQGNRRRPADLMSDNLALASTVIPATFAAGVRRLLFIASSCCYPKAAPQPMRPESLGSGPLEVTSQSYALAKLAGLQLCSAYRQQYGVDFATAIVADLYGPGDDFSTDNSHVLPGILCKLHEAKQANEPHVVLWGTGEPKRDFLYVDDAARACLRLVATSFPSAVFNVTVACYTSIREAAEVSRRVVGYKGEIRFDASKPDGMMLKGLAIEPSLQFHSTEVTHLSAGLQATYAWYVMSLYT